MEERPLDHEARRSRLVLKPTLMACLLVLGCKNKSLNAKRIATMVGLKTDHAILLGCLCKEVDFETDLLKTLLWKRGPLHLKHQAKYWEHLFFQWIEKTEEYGCQGRF